MYEMLIRGTYYNIDKEGRIQRKDIKNFEFSDNWRIYGIARRWNSRPIPWEIIKREIEAKNVTGYLYDIDHGTVRFWAGQWNGHLPKVLIWKKQQIKGVTS